MKCNSNDSLYVWSGWGREEGWSACRGVVGGDGYRRGWMGGGRELQLKLHHRVAEAHNTVSHTTTHAKQCSQCGL